MKLNQKGSSNGYPTIEAFGSFTMDLFTNTSDLDLSLNFSGEKAFTFPRERKISVLMKFADALYSFQNKGHVSGVFPIMRARVPVVKFVDCGTGIECDISVENKDGISRSSIFAIVSSIDERFRILSHLIKFWAKVHDINSAKDHTLSSLTIISLVAFHLQQHNNQQQQQQQQQQSSSQFVQLSGFGYQNSFGGFMPINSRQTTVIRLANQCTGSQTRKANTSGFSVHVQNQASPKH